MVYIDMFNNVPVLVMVRGDRNVNEIKVVNALGIAEHELRLATYDEIIGIGSVEGFVGPVGLNVKVLVDSEVAMMKNIVVGANKKDVHLKNVNFGRDFTGTVAQFRKTVAGDLCPVCGKPMSMERGMILRNFLFMQKMKWP
jgi:prolyl-tRNA synthetase